MAETADIRVKRLRMRSWRRGMKEMDLILGGFADDRLAAKDAVWIDGYEALLDENDQDLYLWVTSRIGGGVPAGPVHLAAYLDEIAGHAAGRFVKSG